MRPLRSLLVLSSLFGSALVVLPTMQTTAATPHPVAPTVRPMPLNSVDPSVLQGFVPEASAGEGLRTAHDGLVPAVAKRFLDTKPFSAVGVTWARQPDAEVEVHVRTRSAGRWSKWVEVEVQANAGGDDGSQEMASPRMGSDALYVGPSDGIEVRVDRGRLAPRDLHLELIDPGTSPADATVVGGSIPAGAASAAEPQPSYVSRAAWGADESLRTCTPATASRLKGGILHTTATSNNYTAAQSASIMRSMYAYHTQSLKWCDLGYNIVVDKFGTIFEGRYGGVDKPVIGAHTGGFNTYTVGVSMIGNHDLVAPTSATLASVKKVFAWKLGLYGVDPLGTTTYVSAGGSATEYPAGTVVTKPVISGHRDYSTKSCPGNYAYPLLPSIRASVNKLMADEPVAQAVLERPSIGTTSAVVGGGDFVVTADVPQQQTWRLRVRNERSGLVVRTITGTAASRITAAWDQRDDSGRKVAAGSYVLKLQSFVPGDASTPFTASIVIYPLTPAIVANGSERLDVFSTAGSGAVEQRIRSNGTTWAPTRNLGGNVVGAPAATVGAAGLQVFARAANGRLYDTGTGRTQWRDLNTSLTAPPAAAVLPDGRNMVFARGADGAVWQAIVDRHGRSPWRSLGGLTVGAPAATARAGGAVTVAVTGTNAQLYYRSLQGSTWTAWRSLGGTLSGSPAVTVMPDRQQLFAFARGPGDELFYKVNNAGSAEWSGWIGMGGVLASAPAVAAWAPNALEVFVAGPGGDYWGSSYNPSWSSWAPALTLSP